jgi:hypothetical protein
MPAGARGGRGPGVTGGTAGSGGWAVGVENLYAGAGVVGDVVGKEDAAAAGGGQDAAVAAARDDAALHHRVGPLAQAHSRPDAAQD